MNDISKKILQSKCKNLLQEYESILVAIINEEIDRINKENKLGDSLFEIAKKTIYNEGLKEGMRRLLSIINNYSNGGN